MFIDTSNPLIDVINKYITADNKVKSFELLYQQLGMTSNIEDELFIKRLFKFNLNESGLVQIVCPSFSGLSKEEIMHITGFCEEKAFENTTEIISYISSFNCFSRGYSSNFLVKGKIVYFTAYYSELMI